MPISAGHPSHGLSCFAPDFTRLYYSKLMSKSVPIEVDHSGNSLVVIAVFCLSETTEICWFTTLG